MRGRPKRMTDPVRTSLTLERDQVRDLMAYAKRHGLATMSAAMRRLIRQAAAREVSAHG